MELGPYGGVLRCSFAETVAFLEGMSLAVSSCYYGIVIVVAVCFFFFQAEDGIRDWSVTGVQTCALPIWHSRRRYCTLRGILPRPFAVHARIPIPWGRPRRDNRSTTGSDRSFRALALGAAVFPARLLRRQDRKSVV